MNDLVAHVDSFSKNSRDDPCRFFEKPQADVLEREPEGCSRGSRIASFAVTCRQPVEKVFQGFAQLNLSE